MFNICLTYELYYVQKVSLEILKFVEEPKMVPLLHCCKKIIAV